MPTWGQILEEIQVTLSPQGKPDVDTVRRKYLRELSDLTGRETILYASNFMQGGMSPDLITINLMDKQALMEVMHGLKGPNLDLILHTPGGSPEALEAIVGYLRTKFTHIRAFVPVAAMSAGTMWALACDEIVMGKHSQLGPIDPQFPLAFGEQIRLAPAQAILDQFQLAKEECKDQANIPAWITVLRTFGASLLQECLSAQKLSIALVSHWLQEGMLRDDDDAEAKAKVIAEKFADYAEHYSHGRPITRDKAREYGVTKITDLEDDQELQDAVLSVHHATVHTFSGTPAAKIVENHVPKTFVILGGQVVVQGGQPQPDQSKPKKPPRPNPGLQGRPNPNRKKKGKRR